MTRPMADLVREVQEIIGAPDGAGAIIYHAMADRAGFPRGGRLLRVADLRRLPVGFRLRLVERLTGPCDFERTIIEVRRSGIVMEGPDLGCRPRESYLPMPSAEHMVGDAREFVIHDGGKLMARYTTREPMFKEVRRG